VTDLLPPPTSDPVGPASSPPGVEPGPAPDIDPTEEEPRRGTRGSGRAAIVAGVVTLLLLVLLVVFLLPLAANQRQQQRADRYVAPSPTFEPGEPAFVLQIPSIGLNQVVVSGAEPSELRGGPGWRNGSASPGQGNTVVLGHSTLWGAPFGRIADVPAGSVISVRTTDGRVYRYRVDRVRTVPNDDQAPMRQSGPKRLTLVTSAGGPFDTDRVVLVAGSAGRPPAVPEDYEATIQRGDPGPYDDRPPGDALLLVSGMAVAVLGIWGALAFRGRRSFLAIALVAGPTIALGVVLVLFHLDAFLPTTF
jgi:LPXTG-site transpeptidase (sortase) family protein